MSTIDYPYHLHIDATVLPEALELEVKRLGFWDAEFAGHPEGYRHFEPLRHLTLKIEDKARFQLLFEQLKQKAVACGLIGYVEGEYVISDIPIQEKPFRDDFPFPFYIERRHLRGEPDESFRQTEFHLVLDKDASDQRLIKKLLDAGLYGAYVRKRDHVALVLTIQGYRRRDIDSVAAALLYYLNEAGGAARCTLQEERAVGYHLVGVDHTKLPEIAGRIDFRRTEMVEMGRTMLRKARKELIHERTEYKKAIQAQKIRRLVCFL